ncbi:hypothetical protein KUTeg_005200 [Tegillarca granosa]|uniref:SUEL-type lectin domain-containing protein n=1 Tax=Tegillarca granosa TaxID=220873 RepID=A0ABQ9FKT6_TEGGR|nr:hypothetical protein KUTeg_005200 [Tegillarca granosa]
MQSKAFTETVCEGFTTTIKCANGKIRIIDAEYGRQDKKTCNDGQAKDTNCSYGKAKQKTAKLCDNKSKCVLESSNEIYKPDPCPGNSKYLIVKYACN